MVLWIMHDVNFVMSSEAKEAQRRGFYFTKYIHVLHYKERCMQYVYQAELLFYDYLLYKLHALKYM